MIFPKSCNSPLKPIVSVFAFFHKTNYDSKDSKSSRISKLHDWCKSYNNLNDLWENVHHPLCVMGHMSNIKWQVTSDKWQESFWTKCIFFLSFAQKRFPQKYFYHQNLFVTFFWSQFMFLQNLYYLIFFVIFFYSKYVAPLFCWTVCFGIFFVVVFRTDITLFFQQISLSVCLCHCEHLLPKVEQFWADLEKNKLHELHGVYRLKYFPPNL